MFLIWSGTLRRTVLLERRRILLCDLPCQIPYGNAATQIMPLMFPDSKVAKEFQCGRKKLSYIISDGLRPYFRKEVIDESNKPHTYVTRF